MTLGSWELFADEDLRQYPAMAELQHINEAEKLSDYQLDIYRADRIDWDNNLEPDYVMSWMHSELNRVTLSEIRANPQYFQGLVERSKKELQEKGIQAR